MLHTSPSSCCYQLQASRCPAIGPVALPSPLSFSHGRSSTAAAAATLQGRATLLTTTPAATASPVVVAPADHEAAVDSTGSSIAEHLLPNGDAALSAAASDVAGSGGSDALNRRLGQRPSSKGQGTAADGTASSNGSTHTLPNQPQVLHEVAANAAMAQLNPIPPRPWALGAAAAAARVGDIAEPTAAALTAVSDGPADAASTGATLHDMTPAAAAVGAETSAPFVNAILTRRQQKKDSSSSGSVPQPGSSKADGAWSEDFVAGVLAAVAAVTERVEAPSPLDSSSSASSSSTRASSTEADRNIAAGLGLAEADTQPLPLLPPQEEPWQQQQPSASQQQPSQYQQQQQQSWRQQQASYVAYGDSLLSDTRVHMLLSKLYDDDTDSSTVKGSQPPSSPTWSVSSSSSSSSGSYLSNSAAASAGWGYSSSSSTIPPRLQRAQWLVEEIHSLQLSLVQQGTNSSSSSSGGAAPAAVTTESPPLPPPPTQQQQQQHSTMEQQQQQASEQQQQLHHEMQQQQLSVMADLQLQVHKLLLSHLTQDATSWRSVLQVVEDFGAFLNPQLVAGALHVLQQMYHDSRRPVGAERGRAARLVWHLLGLIRQWQHRLGPREVVSVLWLLVRLRHIRHLKLQQHLDLRDSLAQQYQHHLHSIDQQLQQLQQQQRQTQQQKQRRRLQQHKLVLLQQLPLLTHAAVLLACARLGLKAHRQLHAGTCQLVCKMALLQVCHLRLQLKQQPGNQQLRQQAAVAASHLALLLYALSELALWPDSALLKATWGLSHPLLGELAPADTAMFAVAFGRMGAAPNKHWGRSFIRVTAEAANRASLTAAADAAAAAAPAAACSGHVQQGSNGNAASSSGSSGDGWGPQRWSLPADAGQNPDSASGLNPADITSILTAAHSMNLNPPEHWVAAMFGASLAQLNDFSLYQSTVLVLSLSKLRVPPQPQWLLAVTRHVVCITGGFAAEQGFSSSSSSSSDEQGMVQLGGSEGATRQQQLLQRATAVLQPPAAAVRLLQVQQQQQHLLLLQQQQQQQVFRQGQQQQAGHQRVRYIHYPDKQRLCLYLFALSRAVALLPEDSQSETLQHLQPLIAAAAKQVASVFDKLQPLDLVQLLLGLQGLRCRPGPGFMAAFAARCEAQQWGFSPSMYSQLKQAYVGLGLAPPRSLLTLMVAALSHDS